MPYIGVDRRAALINGAPMETPGELNYMITSLILEYQGLKGLSYQTINDIIGALGGASHEYYRRVAVPYEYQKQLDNGDVFL
jgi:hypothetical protein